MAQPQGQPISGHFWSPDTASYDAIVTLKDAGTHDTDEDVVWAPWEAICRKYFPESAAYAGGPKYLIRRDAYRGLPPAVRRSAHKPDVVVVELTTPQPGTDGLLRSSKRDILWVECKAPCNDYPSMWKTVIDEATERLKSAHPDRNVWLIVAIGLKWMIFYWDPTSTATNPFPMAVILDNNSGGWPIDQGIRPPPLHQAINVQRYIDASSGIIFTDRAHSLDFWTQAPAAPNQPSQPANLHTSLLFLENIFRAIQGHLYHSANPAILR